MCGLWTEMTDWCSASSGACAANATCVNTDNSNYCFCQPGYFGNGTICVGTRYVHTSVL